MSAAIEHLEAAMQRAFAERPALGGFPYLAETLRRAGVRRNLWFLPACQSLYLTERGPVVIQGEPLVRGTLDVPPFDSEALVRALRTDQAGKSTFPEFLAATWCAGVVRYDVDFEARKVTYFGCDGEEYAEDYPAVEPEYQSRRIRNGFALLPHRPGDKKVTSEQVAELLNQVDVGDVG